jgi:N utilization substance protein B
MVKSRRIARIKVMSVLYAYEITKEPLDKIKKDLLTDFDDEEKLEFAKELIDKVTENVKALDISIRKKINNWEYNRVALLDKIILRMGLAEILYFPEIPPKVTINEAIDLGKEYSTANSGKFINGVLDSILHDLQKANKLNKKGRGLLDLDKKSPKDEK